MPKPAYIRHALLEALRRIPDGEISAVARRARLSVRQLQRMRAGQLDVKLSTFERIVATLGIVVSIGDARPRSRRPAPIGKKPGRPRTMRREPHVGEPLAFDEDEEDPEAS